MLVNFHSTSASCCKKCKIIKSLGYTAVSLFPIDVVFVDFGLSLFLLLLLFCSNIADLRPKNFSFNDVKFYMH